MEKETLNYFNSLINYMAPVMDALIEIKLKREEYKQRIMEEWIRSRQYPRKRKKKVRKILKLEYNIASYDPFDHYKPLK